MSASFVRSCVLATLVGALSIARAGEAGPLLSINVQSAVTRLATGWEGSELLPGERQYAILAVRQVESEFRLIKPVDEERLTRHLVAALATRGFQLARDQVTPGTLLTVHYGRGWLKTPARSNLGASVSDPASLPPAVTVGGASDSISHFMNRSPGNEADKQKAAYEKLFVRITAWAYPSDQKAPAQQLWQTTMVADDPDHRDLNTVVSQLFAAGAPYFDRATAPGGLSVFLPADNAQVKVGTPIAMNDAPVPASRTAAPVAAVAVAAPAELLQPYDLPAGEALTTLHAFSRQSGQEIIFAPEQVRGVRTQAVSGELSARSALARMLHQTGLVAEWDKKSGICIIRHPAR